LRSCSLSTLDTWWSIAWYRAISSNLNIIVSIHSISPDPHTYATETILTVLECPRVSQENPYWYQPKPINSPNDSTPYGVDLLSISAF
jgi:hypothetical protein